MPTSPPCQECYVPKPKTKKEYSFSRNFKGHLWTLNSKKNSTEVEVEGPEEEYKWKVNFPGQVKSWILIKKNKTKRIFIAGRTFPPAYATIVSAYTLKGNIKWQKEFAWAVSPDEIWADKNSHPSIHDPRIKETIRLNFWTGKKSYPYIKENTPTEKFNIIIAQEHRHTIFRFMAKRESREFAIKDAKRAKLWKKEFPGYPKHFVVSQKGNTLRIFILGESILDPGMSLLVAYDKNMKEVWRHNIPDRTKRLGKRKNNPYYKTSDNKVTILNFKDGSPQK